MSLSPPSPVTGTGLEGGGGRRRRGRDGRAPTSRRGAVIQHLGREGGRQGGREQKGRVRERG